MQKYNKTNLRVVVFEYLKRTFVNLIIQNVGYVGNISKISMYEMVNWF